MHVCASAFACVHKIGRHQDPLRNLNPRICISILILLHTLKLQDIKQHGEPSHHCGEQSSTSNTAREHQAHFFNGGRKEGSIGRSCLMCS